MLGVDEGDACRSVREHLARGGRISKLFSNEQRGFFERYAPAGFDLDGLTTLGPIFVLKAKSVPSDVAAKLVGELWIYPDGSLIMELSTKSAPDSALRTAVESYAATASTSPANSRRRPRRHSSSSPTSWPPPAEGTPLENRSADRPDEGLAGQPLLA